MEDLTKIADDPQELIAHDEVSRAEIDIQISTAKRYPRDIKKARQRMIDMATLDQETAESCFYALPRGGKSIIGMSVRLAEIARSCYGNIRTGARFLGESADGKLVRIVGIGWDLETNSAEARETVRRITDSQGNRYNDDMVAVTIAAATAIAIRNATFAVVPKALVKPAYQRARELAVGRTESLADRRVKIFERLAKLNPRITEERILDVVSKQSIDEVGWPDLELLIGLGTALKDGEITVEEAFPPVGEVSADDILDEEPEEKLLEEPAEGVELPKQEEKEKVPKPDKKPKKNEGQTKLIDDD